ncbi:hypothetical protein [Kiloniella laminariae]|uniref:hypothetical protein n=1 Tax=Kiloniella laminariae TaxID=454162 RepID=UPI0003695178|nr:hypothetical protein [Kiloniella laminariae]
MTNFNSHRLLAGLGTSLITAGLITLTSGSAMAECVPLGNGQTYCGRFPPPQAKLQVKTTTQVQNRIQPVENLKQTAPTRTTPTRILRPQAQSLSNRSSRPTAPGPVIFGAPGGTGTPDLVVLPAYGGSSGMPNTGYCGSWNGGNQSVRWIVRNTGTAQAASSVVSLGFAVPLGQPWSDKYPTNQVINVPALAPGQQIQMAYAIPAISWTPTAHPSVTFGFAADYHQDNLEQGGEGNNLVSNAFCLGPAS